MMKIKYTNILIGKICKYYSKFLKIPLFLPKNKRPSNNLNKLHLINAFMNIKSKKLLNK